MLIEQGDGTAIGGPLDVICLLQDVNTGRFHPCFIEEYPLPGPIKDSTAPGPVRLKSRMHHSAGADTLEGGLKLLEELTKMIFLEPGNVLREPVRWNGVIGFVLVMDNWRAEGGLPLQIEEAAG